VVRQSVNQFGFPTFHKANVCSRSSSGLVYGDLKRKEQELLQSAELNRRIIDSSQDCIKVLDLEGRLLTMNPSGRKLMEIDDIQSHLGQSWIDFFQGEDRARAAEAAQAARQGGVGKFRAFQPSFKGAPRWWDIVITPILDAAGRPERLMAISRDITELTQAEAERERLLADQVAAREQLEAERQRLQTILQHLESAGVLANRERWRLRRRVRQLPYVGAAAAGPGPFDGFS
jgi:PAS domain S-box-containing protein